MRVLLSDEGEGWPSDAPSVVPGRVIGEAVSAAGRTLFRVEFDVPVTLRGGRLSFFSARAAVAHVGAWVVPQSVDRVLSSRAPVTVDVWFVDSDAGWAGPPVVAPELRALCTVRT